MLLLFLSGAPQSLVSSLKDHCKAYTIEKMQKVFPDGEQYIRILLEAKGERVAVVQSLYPDQDRKLVELYLALEALQGLGIVNSELILPYMAYTRQDRRFLTGEPISVKALYLPLQLFNVKKVYTLDLHSPKVSEVIGVNIKNLLPHAYMARKAGINIDFILAPDKGALHRAQLLAESLGKPFDYLEKYRDRVTGEISVSSHELDVKNMNIAIVDDIVSTGGTLAKATQMLYNLGANKVYAIITHTLISERTIKTLEVSGLEKLITTNSISHNVTIPAWIQIVDVGEFLCGELLSASM